MKIEMKKLKAFLSAAQTVGIGKRTTMPILGHALITCKQGLTHLSVSNLDQLIVMHCTKSFDGEEMSGTIPLQALKIAAKTKDLGVELLQVSADKYTLAGQTVVGVSAEEYPTLTALMSDRSGHQTIEPTIADLACVIRAVSKDETHYNLNGIHCDHKRYAIVGCDGHRLHWSNGLRSFDQSCILPSAFVHAVLKIARAYKLDTAPIDLDFKKQTATLYLNLFEVSTRFIDGTFPDVDHVIPKNTQKGISIADPTAWLNTLESLIAWSPAKDKACKITFEDCAVKLYAFSAGTGDFNASIDDFRTRGKVPKQIGVNAAYLRDAIESLGDDLIEIAFDGELGPILLQAGNKKAVVMPQRV